MGMVFLVGFIYFLSVKKFNKKMILPMVILFLLGAVQGAIGWIMVKSGLVPEKYFVGHIELATHFIAALGLLSYTLWFALGLLQVANNKVANASLQKLMLGILVILFFQLTYGAFMAGLKAAISAPTWPDINGQMIPASMNELSPWTKNLVSNNIAIHFIHRGLAYLLFLLIGYWWLASRSVKENKLFYTLRSGVLLLVVFQVALGIFTVLNATYPNRLVMLGVSHQFVAMLLLMCVVSLLFMLKRK
jgi:cytochrome c oxidase assembly protein subunit 15